jgi:hypothetical protein
LSFFALPSLRCSLGRSCIYSYIHSLPRSQRASSDQKSPALEHGRKTRHAVSFCADSVVCPPVRPKTNRVSRHVQMRHFEMYPPKVDPLKTSKTLSRLLKSNDRGTRPSIEKTCQQSVAQSATRFSQPRSSATWLNQAWWSQTGSNRRPPACKAGALPAELWPLRKLVGLGRFELPTSPLSGVRSNQLSYRPSGCC